MDLHTSRHAPHKFLFAAVRIYQQRDLTEPGDRLKALAGILQRVALTAVTTLLEGLPVDVLPLALLFIHFGHGPGGPMHRTKFAIWSWAGWLGNGLPYWHEFYSVERSSGGIKETLEDTYSIWWRYDETGRQRVLWKPEDVALESAFHCISAPQEIVMKASLPSKATSRHYALIAVTAVGIDLLLSHSHSAHDDLSKGALGGLYDDEGARCGFVYQDTSLENTHDPMVHLLILSQRTHIPYWTWMYPDDHLGDTVWVMHVVRSEDGIYERRGIGQVLKSCVERSIGAGAGWETLVLG